MNALVRPLVREYMVGSRARNNVFVVEANRYVLAPHEFPHPTVLDVRRAAVESRGTSEVWLPQKLFDFGFTHADSDFLEAALKPTVVSTRGQEREDQSANDSERRYFLGRHGIRRGLTDQR